jgi:hypothetical protein
MDRLVPGSLVAPRSEPAVEPPQRLVSRMRIAGPKIGVDLLRQQLGIEGEGNLLVEDYQLPRQAKAATPNLPAPPAVAGVGALESSGPSQTLFTWKTSMLYLSDRNVAQFDNAVTMRHASGAKMALARSEAAAMNFDLNHLNRFPGREATLTCDNLMAQFERRTDAERVPGSPMGQAARLKSLHATGQSVRMEETNRAAQCTQLTYDSGTGIVRLIGSAHVQAVVMKLDELGGTGYARGDMLEWNQKTGEITGKGVNMLATGGR